ncbi:MAG TPA: glycosyltransferase family 4 protein [Balneolales bacterium]|nr:glycosyltransferase family 4 protein [Balneolales bacterium]
MADDDLQILFAGKYLRGFQKYLIDNPPEGISYSFQNKSGQPFFFETKPWYVKLPLKIWHSTFGDYLGLIFRIIVKHDQNIDAIQTYNRLVRTTGIPYIIYLENPTAHYHYDLRRVKTFLGRKKIKKYIQDDNLKAVICMSDACYRTVDKLIPGFNKTKYRIYPYLPSNANVTEEKIRKRCEEPVLQALFVSSDFLLKGGAEIITAVEQLRDLSIHLTLVTKRDRIPAYWQRRILNLGDMVSLIEFNLVPDELSQIYARSHVLLHPSYKDSFGIVVLEAIKAGLTVIGTNLYALPEMVTPENGYLTDPPKPYFTAQGIPNPDYWKNEKKLLNDIPNLRLTAFLQDSINELSHNRGLLKKKSLCSWNKSHDEPFSDEFIRKQWHDIYQDIFHTIPADLEK